MSAIGESPPEAKLRIRRSTRVLQLSAGVLLVLGGICFAVPSSDWILKIAGILEIVAGGSGLLGLYFTWQRGLMLFTVMTWALTAMTAILIMQCANAIPHEPPMPSLTLPSADVWRHSSVLTCDTLSFSCYPRLVLKHSTDPLSWTLWLIVGLASLPGALLSSTMHLLRVWRGPRTLVEDNQQRAPLVDAAADVGEPAQVPQPSRPAQPTPGSLRPVWPPPAGHSGLGADLLATGRVASAAQSGDYSQVGVRDVAAATRTATAAAAVWPPPK